VVFFLECTFDIINIKNVHLARSVLHLEEVNDALEEVHRLLFLKRKGDPSKPACITKM
jgi:hypothetical protein